MENAQNATRREILVLLKQSGGMTVEQMSQALGISAMGVRQHLSILERDGLVEMLKKRGGMGRPAHVYFLTNRGDEAAFPRRYDSLAMTILEALDEIDGEDKVEAIFRKRQEWMEQGLAPRMTGKPVAERVKELAESQQENGYMTEAGERPDGGYYLVEHNCTIARVSKKYPVACQLELELFRKLLGSDVERTQCIAEGDTRCTYLIAAKSEALNKNGKTRSVAAAAPAMAIAAGAE